MLKTINKAQQSLKKGEMTNKKEIILWCVNYSSTLPDKLEATLLEGKYLHVIPCVRSFYHQLFLHNIIGA